MRISSCDLARIPSYLFALFESVGGGRQYKVDNLDQGGGVGRFLGRIHKASAGRTFQHRPTIKHKMVFVSATQDIRKLSVYPYASKKNAFSS